MQQTSRTKAMCIRKNILSSITFYHVINLIPCKENILRINICWIINLEGIGFSQSDTL